MSIRNMSPEDLAALMKRNEVLLIDVREACEFATGIIRGAELYPLSYFEPEDLPDPAGRPVVFYCAGGIRSMQALELCQKAGLPYDTHLEGGIDAWKVHGFPIERPA